MLKSEGTLVLCTSSHRPNGSLPKGILRRRQHAGDGSADDRRIETFGLLIEAHSHLVHRLGTELEKECGLPLRWLEVLVRLARAPGGCMNATRLAADLALSSGGASRLVDRVIRAGLVERVRDSDDRRMVHICLAPAGNARLAEVIPVHPSGLERHLATPLGGELRVFADLTRALRDSNR